MMCARPRPPSVVMGCGGSCLAVGACSDRVSVDIRKWIPPTLLPIPTLQGRRPFEVDRARRTRGGHPDGLGCEITAATISSYQSEMVFWTASTVFLTSAVLAALLFPSGPRPDTADAVVTMP
jgi:hypothetical protein